MLKYMRRHAQVLGGVGVTATTIGSLLSETVCINYWKEYFGSYRDGEIEPVSDRCIVIIDRMLSLIPVRSDQEATLDVFTCYGQEPVVLGTLHLQSGSQIGLPPTYRFKYMSDIVNSDLSLMNKIPIDWKSPRGQELAKSLLLTDNELEYAIARSLAYSISSRPIIESCIIGGGVLVWGCSNNLLNQLVGYKLKGWARAIMYTFTASFWLLGGLTLKDVYKCRLDRTVDKRICGLSPQFAQAGVDWYTKSIQRNTALRELTGPLAKDLYTPKGNLKRGFREPSLPVFSRLTICQEQLELWKEGKLTRPVIKMPEGHELFNTDRMISIRRTRVTTLQERIAELDKQTQQQGTTQGTMEGAEETQSQ